MDSRLINPITVIWGNGDDQHVEVSSINQLDEILDRVQGFAEQGQPPIVDVEVPDQGVMRIGFSARVAVLSVMSSSLDPPYFNSVGNQEDGPDLIFSYRGHWTDFPVRFSVPVADAREAVRRFALGEYLPQDVKWAET